MKIEKMKIEDYLGKEFKVNYSPEYEKMFEDRYANLFKVEKLLKGYSDNWVIVSWKESDGTKADTKYSIQMVLDHFQKNEWILV